MKEINRGICPPFRDSKMKNEKDFIIYIQFFMNKNESNKNAGGGL